MDNENTEHIEESLCETQVACSIVREIGLAMLTNKSDKNVVKSAIKTRSPVRKKKLSPEARHKVAVEGGKKRWDNMTPEQRENMIKVMHDAKQAKRRKRIEQTQEKA